MFLRPKSWFCIRLPNIEQASIKKVDSTKNISDRPLSEIGRKLVRELSFETTPVRRTVNLLARKDDHQSGGFRFVKNKGKEFAKALKGTTATTAMAVASWRKIWKIFRVFSEMRGKFLYYNPIF